MHGQGTSDYPFLIEDVDDLQDMANDLDAYYKLANDIDASATTGWNGGAGFLPVGGSANPFTGSLKGQKYTISDLFINRGAYRQALFGQTDGATVKNVTIVDCDITAGGVANILYVGALIGRAIDTVISNCHSSGEITSAGTAATYHTGGLIGKLEGSSSSTINDCSSTCTVISGTKKVWNTGGLIGELDDGATANSCYALGNITSTGTDYAYSTGGLIGLISSTSTVNDSFARGTVVGDRKVGGLVGSCTFNAVTEDCYSTGAVTGNSDIGGLIGICAGTATDSFWDTQTSGQAASAGGTGKTTAEMKTKATFTAADWDFIIIWFINGITNDGYPFHWAMPPEPMPDAPRATVAVEDKITLECVRNVEMATGGRFYINEEGKAAYRSRYARNA